MNSLAVILLKYFIMCFTYVLYISCFHYVFKANIKINRFELFIVIIILGFYYYYNQYIPMFLNYIISWPIIYLVLDCFYSGMQKKKLIFTFLLTSLSILIDFISSYTILNDINATPSFYEGNQIVLYLLFLLLVPIVSFLILDYKHIKKEISFITGISENHSLIISLFSLAVIILFSISIININLSISKILIGICLICVYTLMIIIIRLETSKNNLNMLVKMYSNKNEFYMKVSEESKMLRHNIINILAGLRTTNENNIDLINDRVKQYSDDIVWLNNIEYAPSSIKGFLLEKLYPYQGQGLKLKIINNFSQDIMLLLGARKFNALCEAIGVNLDNSIDACLKSEEKILVMDFSVYNNELIVKMINSFNGDIDLESLGNMNYTTKSRGHGYGLHSILKSKKIKTKITINDDWFCVEMKLDLLKKIEKSKKDN